MKSFTRLLLGLAYAPTAVAAPFPAGEATPRHNLMPVPAVVRFQAGRLVIDASFPISVDGHSDDRLRAGIDRVSRRLEGRIGVELQRPAPDGSGAARLLIKCKGPGSAVPSLDEDESYSLEVSAGQAVLGAATVVGALRGLETFLQLLECDREGYYVPSVAIQDKPRFRWRGLLIDIARHYQPPEVIKRNLDAMAAVKLNVLHWHLTDDQGFRIESRKYPELARMGSDGLYYTQEQAREIVAYARDRGIRVVPEFDMPGHATSWLVSHPELASGPGPYRIERNPGIMEPAFDPTREEVYKFIDGFLGEMASLFPDPYMHIGGDENEGKQWDKNPQIQAFMKERAVKDNHQLQAYFNQRINKILKKHGKRMIGWEEILSPDLPKDVAVQSWRGPASLAEAAKKGYDGLLSAGYYIDLMYPASQHYLVDPVAAGAGLGGQDVAHILGGEATMWGEYVSPETIDSRIWPRTAAIAERFWSAASVNDVPDMYRRLDAISIQLEELGLTHEKNVEMMLRRLTGIEEVGSLRLLVDAVEPVKEYNRGRFQRTTMLAPLTRLVDVARPDSKTARRLSYMVDGLLADAPRFRLYRNDIRALLTEWKEMRPQIDRIIDQSPALRDAEPLARDLAQIGEAGLEALSYLSTGVAPAAGWAEANSAMLKEAARPRAAVEIVVIPAVRQLVVAAGQVASLNGASPQEWNKKVKSLATPKQEGAR